MVGLGLSLPGLGDRLALATLGVGLGLVGLGERLGLGDSLLLGDGMQPGCWATSLRANGHLQHGAMLMSYVGKGFCNAGLNSGIGATACQ